MPGAIDPKAVRMLQAISAMSEAEKFNLCLNPHLLGVTRCAVLSASGLPDSLITWVLREGSPCEQMTVALNNSVPLSVVRLYAESSPFAVVRRQASAKLQDRLLLDAPLPARSRAS